MKSPEITHLIKRLREEKTTLREALVEDLISTTVFLIPYIITDITSENNIAAVYSALSAYFTVVQKKLSTQDLLLDTRLDTHPDIAVAAFFIKNASGEHVTSILQSLFTQRKVGALLKQKRVRLADYGFLLPRTCEIQCYSFAHGVGHYYRYRLAKHKLHRIPQQLREYLLALPPNCPNELFSTGPRASNFEVRLHIDLTHLKDHPCISYAQSALVNRHFKSAHEDVEKYMLENDPECVATEVPIWLDSSEMKQFGWAHLSTGCLTGHIDVLRCEDDQRVGIWDFKPLAVSSINAKIQIFLYALMLSTRTGIPLNLFRCGYFDAEDAFVFLASQAIHC